MALTQGQRIVLEALSEIGPITDIGLSVYVQHVADADMSSSGIRSRRAELQQQGFVTNVGSKRLKSGRHAAIHGLTNAGQDALTA